MPNCQIEGENGGECGRPPFTNANELCEKHYQAFYPRSYERIKGEIRCDNCKDNPSKHCEVCHNRGWV